MEATRAMVAVVTGGPPRIRIRSSELVDYWRQSIRNGSAVAQGILLRAAWEGQGMDRDGDRAISIAAGSYGRHERTEIVGLDLAARMSPEAAARGRAGLNFGASTPRFTQEEI